MLNFRDVEIETNSAITQDVKQRDSIIMAAQPIHVPEQDISNFRHVTRSELRVNKALTNSEMRNTK